MGSKGKSRVVIFSLAGTLVLVASWARMADPPKSSATLEDCVREVTADQPWLDTTYKKQRTRVYLTSIGISAAKRSVDGCSKRAGVTFIGGEWLSRSYVGHSQTLIVTDPMFAKFDKHKGMISFEPSFLVRYPEGIVALVLTESVKPSSPSIATSYANLRASLGL